MSMITASTWVPRGAAATSPSKHDVDEKELARISRLAKLQLKDVKNDFEQAQNGTSESVDGRSSLDEADREDVKMTQPNGCEKTRIHP